MPNEFVATDMRLGGGTLILAGLAGMVWGLAGPGSIDGLARGVFGFYGGLLAVLMGGGLMWWGRRKPQSRDPR